MTGVDGAKWLPGRPTAKIAVQRDVAEYQRANTSDGRASETARLSRLSACFRRLVTISREKPRSYVSKKWLSYGPGTGPRASRWQDDVGICGTGASFMTEERARYYAKVLARGIGTTFYAVRSREGRFLAVQIPSGDCEILARVKPPSGATESQQFRRKEVSKAA